MFDMGQDVDKLGGVKLVRFAALARKQAMKGFNRRNIKWPLRIYVISLIALLVQLLVTAWDLVTVYHGDASYSTVVFSVLTSIILILNYVSTKLTLQAVLRRSIFNFVRSSRGCLR